jgi:8-oxo-dGTP pyrophosphatase MutT (NUDIX family)
MSPDPAVTPVPRPAATVVVIRDDAGGPEVLLLERHPDSRFAPGAFAFPGGRMEAADAEPAVLARVRGLDAAAAARRLGDVLPPERALGYWVTALRELFEETGVLLASGAVGVTSQPGAGALRVAEARARSRRDPAAVAAVLAEAGLWLAAERLAYLAHWITPEERPIRFDARFFLAEAPPGAVPEPDGLEVVSCRWLAPAAALRAAEAGTIALLVPTRITLGALAACRSVKEALAAAGAATIRPVLPRVVREGGTERILLPGDPGYF